MTIEDGRTTEGSPWRMQSLSTVNCQLSTVNLNAGGSTCKKKIPQRQCMGCRERKAKKELIRVVRGVDGTVSLDFSGKAPGRGAYLCPDPECLKKAIRSKALSRSLETEIPQEVYDRLEKEMEQNG